MPHYQRGVSGGDLEISFEKKPEEAVRSQLKQAQFRWDSKRFLWHAPETPERLALARRLAGEMPRVVAHGAKGGSGYGLRLTLQDLVKADAAAQQAWIAQLRCYVNNRLAEDNAQHQRDAVGGSQKGVWLDCFQFIQRTLQPLDCGQDMELIFEYIMPGSVYQRPDVLLLTRKKVILLEFKKKLEPQMDAHKSDVAQLIRYREWLEHHHMVTKDRKMQVVGYLVCTPQQAMSGTVKSVQVLNGHTVCETLAQELQGEEPCDFCDEWLSSPRTEMPDMLQAIGRLYGDGCMPYISDVNQVCLDKVNGYIADAQRNHKKVLILVSGVPGAGKTAVGQSVVFEQNRLGKAQAVYLSGNGPLVEVLQDEVNVAVGSAHAGENVIQSMKAFKAAYFYTESQIPQQSVLIFDEAQRAWDAQKMGGDYSEPEGLLQVGERIFRARGFTVVMGLYGNGQSIFEGEEAGIQLWEQAIRNHQNWTVIGPEGIAIDPGPNNVRLADPALFLPVSLRADFIDCSPWVEAVVTRSRGDAGAPRKALEALKNTSMEIFLTRDFQKVRQYGKMLEQYHKNWKYGLLVSNFGRPTVLTDRWAGWELGFRTWENRTVKRGMYAPWFRGECKNLERACAVFGNQGLELDCPIVLFGGDYLFEHGNWTINVYQRERQEQRYRDLATIVENNYRVLLSRARRQMVLMIPKHPMLDSTYRYFLEMGVEAL